MDTRLAKLLADDAEIEQIATGFGFTEGPAWCDKGDFLVFSDVPGNALWRWDAVDGVREYRRPSNMGNGSTYDAQGRLITCEHATSRVVREENGQVTVLADQFGGRELNSPNDVVVARDGRIYFTDPTYGRQEFYGVPREPSQPYRGLYRLRTTGDLDLLASDFGQPNGLCFSLDERVLFVNDTDGMHIRAFRITPDASLSGGDVWADLSPYSEEGPGAPDGMKIDVEGDIYCVGPGGVHVFDPAGDHLGSVKSPETVGNFAWGEHDRLSLFICASTSLYRIMTRVPGYQPY